MNFVDTMAERNTDFANEGFTPGLTMLPSQKTMIIGCVDPRVDPMEIFKLKSGEAAIIRNVGGRITPTVFETMAILGTVSRAAGAEVGAGWNLVVLHHTDCGITGCYHQAPELLAKHFGVPAENLESLSITDPYYAVVIDIAALKANPRLPAALTVSGWVYDVADGKAQRVVAPSQLRPGEI